MVILNDVKMSYPGMKRDVLRDIDLTIEDGEFVFLVGPSGSGKTTIIKLLTGEVQASGGRVHVNGFELRSMKRRKLHLLRRTIGVIFQDFRLIRNKSVYENVAFAMRVVGASEREIRQRVPYVLQLVGLDTKAKRLPDELSGGEQQRVGLARALVNNPTMIIADEPTGNIDPALSYEIVDLLNEINRHGTTVLMVTHEHSLVKRFQRRVVEIDNGCIVADSAIGGEQG